MAAKYYVIPGVATSLIDDTVPALDAPWIEVTESAYQAELAEFLKDSGVFAIQASRSSQRYEPHPLQDRTLDAGRGYAVFIDDPGIDITQVDWELNGSPVNTEFSAPWDYNGTDVGGGAIKISFVAGIHEIDAHVTYGSGSTITLTATFEVD